MVTENSQPARQRKVRAIPLRKVLSSVTGILILLFSTACAPALETLLQTKASPTTTHATNPVPATGNEPAKAPAAANGAPAASAATNTMGNSAAQAPTATGQNAMPGMSDAQGSVIEVYDQPIVNGTVKVGQVISKGPGWVVIYTIGANGQPDQPIGHTAVQAGQYSDVIVQIDVSKATGTLYAQLHADRGVVGKFEFPGPDEPVMNGVQMIASTFKITQASAANNQPAVNNQGNTNGTGNMNMGSPSPTQPANTANNGANTAGSSQMVPNIIASSQPIIDGKVVIPEVDSNGPAWLVIHKENGDGTLGPMAGYAHVNDGINKNVVVQLDLASTSTEMYAMLHQDAGVIGKLEYPGPDEPVFVNGMMVAPKFQVTTSSTADVVVALGSMPETSNFLVDGHDMSLYISLRDTPGKSNCTGDCLKTWTPLAATGRIVAGSGVQANKLGVILRADGVRQVTFMNAPLYLYTKDNKPGDLNGQGVDGIWYLVTP